LSRFTIFSKKEEKLTHILGVDTLTGHRKPTSQLNSPNVTDNIHTGYLTAVSRHSLSVCAFPILAAAFTTHSAVVMVRLQHQTVKVTEPLAVHALNISQN
jgi:hypothetical protein